MTWCGRQSCVLDESTVCELLRIGKVVRVEETRNKKDQKGRGKREKIEVINISQFQRCLSIREKIKIKMKKGKRKKEMIEFVRGMNPVIPHCERVSSLISTMSIP